MIFLTKLIQLLSQLSSRLSSCRLSQLFSSLGGQVSSPSPSAKSFRSLKSLPLSSLSSSSPQLLLCLFMSVSLAGCGSQHYATEPGNDQTEKEVSLTPQPIVENRPGNQTEPPVPDQALAGVSLFLEAEFKIFGSRGGDGKTTYTQGSTLGNTFQIHSIKTDNVLKVQLDANEIATNPGTAYSYPFQCVRVLVTVGDITKSALIKPSTSQQESYWPCQNAQVKPVLDFSSQASPGHGLMTASIRVDSYDNCASTTGNLWNVGCMFNAIYHRVAVSTSAAVYVNGSIQK